DIAPNDRDFIYYPYLNINKDIGKDNIYNQNNTIEIFNTDGFTTVLSKNYPIYSLMFKGYQQKNSGLFIKKIKNSIIVPNILHCIVLSNTDNNYIRAWGKILRQPWEYLVWTDEK